MLFMLPTSAAWNLISGKTPSIFGLMSMEKRNRSTVSCNREYNSVKTWDPRKFVDTFAQYFEFVYVPYFDAQSSLYMYYAFHNIQ